MITFGQRLLRNFDFCSNKEWLLTDGEGGYANSTVCFMNNRRQHSLLTVSLAPPLRRFTLLNKVDEEVIINGASYFLGTNRYPDTIFPKGYQYLAKFSFHYFPEAVFDLDGNQIVKKIVMPRNSNSVFINYTNISKTEMILRLLPLLSFRFKDDLRKSREGFLVDELPDGVRIIADFQMPRLYLKLSRMYSTSPESYWYYNFTYDLDPGNPENNREDLYNIGYWETVLAPGESTTLAASTRDLAEFDYWEIERRYTENIEKLRAGTNLPKKYFHLIDSVSKHIVKSQQLHHSTIMRGYPISSPLLRDSMISINGSSISQTDPKFEKELLHSFASNSLNGSLPSAVNEDDLTVSYKDPIIALYFGVAVARHYLQGKDISEVKPLLPFLTAMVEDVSEGRSKDIKLGTSGTLEYVISENQYNSTFPMVSPVLLNLLWYNLIRTIQTIRGELGLKFDLPQELEISKELILEMIDSRIQTDSDHDLAFALALPFTPFAEEQKCNLAALLAKRVLADDGLTPHPCPLAIIYLTEILYGCETYPDLYRDVYKAFESIFVEQKYNSCLNEFALCVETNPKKGGDISSAVISAEAVRVINKLKLK
ncbi:MAG: glycogen debranching enzyme N-terminal domain-containing protein [Candidatus Kryptoniota bacterium]